MGRFELAWSAGPSRQNGLGRIRDKEGLPGGPQKRQLHSALHCVMVSVIASGVATWARGNVRQPPGRDPAGAALSPPHAAPDVLSGWMQVQA